MTQQIEQLATARLGFEIQKIVPDLDAQDLEQGLWYAHNKTHWETGTAISETDKQRLFATEMIVNLGQRSLQLMYGDHPKKEIVKNPLFRDVDEKLSGIITYAPPFEDTSNVLNAGYVLKLREYELDAHINDIFERVPEYMGEYWIKRCLALEMYQTEFRKNCSKKSKPEVLELALSTMKTARTAMGSASY